MDFNRILFYKNKNSKSHTASNITGKPETDSDPGLGEETDSLKTGHLEKPEPKA